MRASVGVVFVRSAGALRALWAVMVAITVAGPSFIEPMPRAAVPAVAVSIGWSVYVLWLARGEPFPSRAVAWLDAAIFAALLLGESSLVPAPLVGDGTSWVFAGASVSVLLASLLVSSAETLAIVLVLIVAYLAGIAAAGESVLAPDGVPTSVILLVEGVLEAGVVRALWKTADQADVALRREVASERTLIVEKAKARERAAQERLVHDKIKGTLWLVGEGHLLDRRDVAVNACQESLAALDDLRRGRIADDVSRSVSGAVHEVVAWARSIGLDVVLGPQDPDAPAVEAADVTIPPVVRDEVAAAARQALANVRAHAGTDQARVLTASGPGFVQVTIVDHGRGFDPARTRVSSTGIDSSIVGRMQAIGGSAQIRSRPGRGTTVDLLWRAAPEPVAEEPRGDGWSLRLYGAPALKIMAVAGLVFMALALYAAVHYAADYTHPWVAPAAWAVDLVVGVAVVAAIGRRPRPAAVWLGIVLSLAAATAVVLDCRAQGVLGFANWAFGTTVWPVAFAAAHLPVRRVLAVMLVHDAIQSSVIAAKLGANLPGLVKLSAILLENAMLQVGFAVAFVILTRTTGATAQAAWQAGANRARLYAAQIAHRSRAIRAARIDEDVFALLHAVSSGTLDPNDPTTLRRARLARRAMRREATVTALHTPAGDLEALAERAAADDVEVELHGAGEFARFPDRIRAPMLAAAAGALHYACPGTARVMLHAHADMTVRDWQVADPADHRDVHSMTLTFTAPLAAVRALREAADTTAPATAGAGTLAVDLDIDTDDAPAGDTVQVWIAMAGR